MNKAWSSFIRAKLFILVGRVRVRMGEGVQGKGVVRFYFCVEQFKLKHFFCLCLSTLICKSKIMKLFLFSVFIVYSQK